MRHVFGRSTPDGTNYYFDICEGDERNATNTSSFVGKCLPFPSRRIDGIAPVVGDDNVPLENDLHVYRPPTDPTLVPVLFFEDSAPPPPPLPPRHSPLADTEDNRVSVSRSTAPSLHSRWLFEEWRMRRGEVNGTGTQTKEQSQATTAEARKRLRSFVCRLSTSRQSGSVAQKTCSLRSFKNGMRLSPSMRLISELKMGPILCFREKIHWMA